MVKVDSAFSFPLLRYSSFPFCLSHTKQSWNPNWKKVGHTLIAFSRCSVFASSSSVLRTGAFGLKKDSALGRFFSAT